MRRRLLSTIALVVLCAAFATACAQKGPRTFATAEDAARELIRIVKAGKLDDLIVLFGPDSQELADGSDPATGRMNRQTFAVAAAENWQLTDDGPDRKILVIGNEAWPFPVPIVKDGTSWRFDAAAGEEEVIARRVGRNELAVIAVCRTYVAAQKRYALDGHDGKPAGLYAQSFRSDSGKHNGLYWLAARGEKLSPLGDLVAQAAEEGRVEAGRKQPSTFHGYRFKILTAQEAAVSGGAKNYVINGEMSGGFALVAWPADYDITGVMTFIVNHDGTLHEKDLGPDTPALAQAMTAYNPDSTWSVVPVQTP
jgi:predicted small lipoprotein YifL